MYTLVISCVRELGVGGKVLGLTEDFVWGWISGGIAQTLGEGINCHYILLKLVGLESKPHRSNQLDPHCPSRIVALTQ